MDILKIGHHDSNDFIENILLILVVSHSLISISFFPDVRYVLAFNID